MQTPHATTRTRISAVTLFAPLLGLGALAGTACNSGTPLAAAPSTSINAAASAPAATPIAVNCGPGQQALIRPGVLGGQTISQVECVPVTGMPVTGTPAAAPTYASMPGAIAAGYSDAPRLEQPVVYRPAARPVSYQAAAPAPARHVVARKTGRSWQKSALVIGSSAGVGAGVGGAIHGKKGALLGAAVGGGAATLWDQMTRRR